MGDNFKWSADLLIPTSVTATQEATNFPAARLYDMSHPYRPWRSTNTTTAQVLVFDLGSAMAVKGIYIFRANFNHLELRRSANGTTFTSLNTAGYTLDFDLLDGYRKLFQEVDFNNRYWSIRIPANTPTDGDDFFQLGMAVALGSINELEINPEVPVTIEADEEEVGRRIGAIIDVAELGPTYLIMRWRNSRIPTANLHSWQNVKNLGKTVPFVAWHNTGNKAEAYLLQRDGPADIQLRGVLHHNGDAIPAAGRIG